MARFAPPAWPAEPATGGDRMRSRMKPGPRPGVTGTVPRRRGVGRKRVSDLATLWARQGRYCTSVTHVVQAGVQHGQAPQQSRLPVWRPPGGGQPDRQPSCVNQQEINDKSGASFAPCPVAGPSRAAPGARAAGMRDGHEVRQAVGRPCPSGQPGCRHTRPAPRCLDRGAGQKERGRQDADMRFGKRLLTGRPRSCCRPCAR